jgi:hypothetical protein
MNGGSEKSSVSSSRMDTDRKERKTRIALIYAIGLSTWLLHHYNRGVSLVFADDRFIGHRSHLDCLFQKAEEEFPA